MSLEEHPFLTIDAGNDCYLATVCIEHRSFLDERREQTATHYMRDEWLVKQPGGKAEIDEYYPITQGNVKKIHMCDDSDEVLKRFYQEYILP